MMKCFPAIVLTVVSLYGLNLAVPSAAAKSRPAPADSGSLDVLGPDGETVGTCPLKHTDVQVDIAGFIARVHVTQQFHNPYEHKIEAVYTFPLSQSAAVDDMTMIIGERTIRGLIKERGEAREIYERAREAGHVASLLDQERPNIFTQHVANIEPGAEVEIRISYVENLDWEEGVFSFDFPTVVGPRYMPGNATGQSGTGWAPDTDQVPDASRISPPVTPPGTRSGHDISITVSLDAGLPIQHIESLQHEVDVEYADEARSASVIRLRQMAEIPNRDFVLKYRTASDQITDALLTHTDERGRFFTLILQPPQRVTPEWVVPKEMVFVIDKSGSMRGFPIETAKQTMRRCIENLNPNDTFNLMTFEGGVGFCFPEPVPNTAANRQKALTYLGNLQGSGGTEMMKAINACLGGQRDPERVRIVCFMTDGYVGNDHAIIEAVQRNAGTARVFSFGIGSSVNRYLLDGMARAGRGDVEYVLSPEQSSEASERFYQRVSFPVLTDIELDFAGIEVAEVLPARIPDLFSAKPVIIKGQYLGYGSGVVTLRGRRGSEDFERTIVVDLPDDEPANDVLASLWARAKVDDLMNRDLLSVQQGTEDPGLKERVVDLALAYRLLTQYTSFVAVEEKIITEGGKPVTVTVPVEMPQGVSYEGVFGTPGECKSFMVQRSSGAMGQVCAEALSTPRLSRLAPQPPSGNGRKIDALDWKKDEEGRGWHRDSGKLAGGLAGLSDRLDKDGDYDRGRILVRDGRVEIAIHLSDASEANLARLTKLGFKLLHESKVAEAMVIGTIAVDRLDELAALDCVVRVEPTRWSQIR